MRRTASIFLTSILLASLGFASGCAKDRSQMTDAELGLNLQQAQGRRLFNVHCAICHQAYSSHAKKAPGLKDLFRKPYLPSGLTPTDEHVEQTIVRGRGMMPPFRDQLDQEQIDDLVAYLRTL